MATITDTTILDCGHVPSPHESFSTGYGTGTDGKTYCYACCADRDRADMIETGRATLYLTRDKLSPARQDTYGRTIHALYSYKLTNWPGSLTFNVGGAVRHGRHNIARTRIDAWFTGPDGKPWHAVQYGENTQIAHCRRVKG
jgi:hypothetical protein